MTEPEKQCSKCLAFKPLGEFSNHKTSKGGKRANCKCCASEAQRKRYAANPEKQREDRRKRRAANPEKYNEAARKRHAANPEKRNQSRRKRHAANPEKRRESSRKRYAANPEEIKEDRRQYYAANPEKQREYRRKRYTRARHARNQCAVINALDPKKWELLEAKLKTLNPLRK